MLLRPLRSLGRGDSYLENVGSDRIASPSLKGRRPRIRHSRGVRCQEIRLPTTLCGINVVVVTPRNGATESTTERHQEKGAENSSNEDPNTHGDLQMCRKKPYHDPVEEDTLGDAKAGLVNHLIFQGGDYWPFVSEDDRLTISNRSNTASIACWTETPVDEPRWIEQCVRRTVRGLRSA